MVTVATGVLIFLVHIFALAVLDITWILMNITALVSIIYNSILSNLYTDIIECDTNNGGCDHNCINTIGSYQCQCREGYETKNNGTNCTGTLFITYYQLLFYAKKTLTNVFLTIMEDVNKYVQTQMEASLVLVLLDLI